VIPVILASDKIHLSTFGGDKQAWPVYITIGNINKDLCRKPSSRTTLLLGYLPVAKLACYPEARQGLESKRIFHDCMRVLLGPLYEVGDGVILRCPDQKTQLTFPILAAYVVDYPE
jgi:hypothetical protein